MSSILRTFEFLSLGTWVGGIIFLNSGVAPGAFATLGNRDLAGAFLSSGVPVASSSCPPAPGAASSEGMLVCPRHADGDRRVAAGRQNQPVQNPHPCAPRRQGGACPDSRRRGASARPAAG